VVPTRIISWRRTSPRSSTSGSATLPPKRSRARNVTRRLISSPTFIEAYGDSTNGYEPLMQFGTRHALPGVGRWLTLRGNNAQALPPFLKETSSDFTRDEEFNYQSAENALRDQCGDECVDSAIECIIESGDNPFRDFCCGIAMCPLMLEDPEDAWQIYEYFMCRSCLCLHETEPDCGRNCLCSSLDETGEGYEAEFKEYFTKRGYCLSQCPPCNSLPMMPIDPTGNYNNCPDEFFYPWPSCFDICMNPNHGACDLSYSICLDYCLVHYANQPGALAECEWCCNDAHSECIGYEESGYCDPYAANPNP